MPEPQEILDALTTAFEATCKRPLDQDASDAFRKFIEVTVIRAVDLGADFEGRRRYLEKNFRDIGTALEATDSAAPVSRKELIDACAKQVEHNLAKNQDDIAKAQGRGDLEKLERLTKEGPLCETFTRAQLD